VKEVLEHAEMVDHRQGLAGLQRGLSSSKLFHLQLLWETGSNEPCFDSTKVSLCSTQNQDDIENQHKDVAENAHSKIKNKKPPYTINGQEVETLAPLIPSPEEVMAPPANEQMQERGKTTHGSWVVFPLSSFKSV